MSQDLSIIHLVLNASLLVQLVMAGLLIVSIASWAAIFGKVFSIKRVNDGNEGFEREFWSGRTLTELNVAVRQKRDASPMERIFVSGMTEFMKLRERRLEATAQLDGARRAMRASLQRELDEIERHLSFLASVGSVSPYVGLFGTVWGIMNSFTAIAGMQNTNLAVVAPGIAEALFATAIGLVAAIPAVLAYNKLNTDLARFAARLESFATEFGAILSRQTEVAANDAAAPAASAAE